MKVFAVNEKQAQRLQRRREFKAKVAGKPRRKRGVKQKDVPQRVRRPNGRFAKSE
jgi:hypothetical protein|tara:strand:- start:277 stop:441 length:165 start_codon:yes stop_codon:yes gene_type:complete